MTVEAIRVTPQNIKELGLKLSGTNQVKFDDKVRFIDGYDKVVDASIGDVIVNVDNFWYAVLVNPETIKKNNDVVEMVNGIIESEDLKEFYHFTVKDYNDGFEVGKIINAGMKWSEVNYEIVLTPTKIKVGKFNIKSYEILAAELLSAGQNLPNRKVTK